MKTGFEVVLRDEQIVEVEADHFAIDERVVMFYLNGTVVAFFTCDMFTFAIRHQDKA